MKLNYDQLPGCIKEKIQAKQIHKIVKPSSTIISVYLRDRNKKVWIKSNNNWTLKIPPPEK
tara:strand:- start:1268 stop:1450 length:183 start_codon:yes stop_codon:yes gene_type:complete